MTEMKIMDPEKIRYLIIHCAATRPSMDIGVSEIRRWHMEKGWIDVGYHFVIRRDGTIERGRSTSTPGAHARGHNGHSIGICLVGGVTEDDVRKAEDNFTPEQMASLKTLLQKMRWKFPQAKIIGHRDVDNRKACPSFDVAALMREWGWQ